IVSAPDQRALVRALAAGHTARFELRQNEAIDIVLHPGFVLYLRRRRFGHGLECPVILSLPTVRRSVSSRTRGAGIRSAHPNPGDKIVDLRGWKFSVGRHLQSAVVVTNGCDQQAFLRIARNNRRTRVSAFFPTTLPIELQCECSGSVRRTVAHVAAL